MNSSDPYITTGVYLRGEDLIPSQITSVLGFSPSRSLRRGEFKPGSVTAVAKTGLWCLLAQTPSLSPREHLRELVQTIGTPPVPLVDLPNVQDAYLDIFIALDREEMPSTAVHWKFTSDEIKQISSYGLAVHVTIACTTEAAQTDALSAGGKGDGVRQQWRLG